MGRAPSRWAVRTVIVRSMWRRRTGGLFDRRERAHLETPHRSLDVAPELPLLGE
jgi:hypothetical protein